MVTDLGTVLALLYLRHQIQFRYELHAFQNFEVAQQPIEVRFAFNYVSHPSIHALVPAQMLTR